MNETLFLKLLAEQHDIYIKAAFKCRTLFAEHGGDVTTLGDPTDPTKCPKGYIKNDAGQCVPNEG